MENESNKQTAVEWFIEQLEQKGDAWENVSIRRIQISIDVSDYLELKRQALQMEKEQVIDAVNSQRQLGWDEKGEQYYKEKYGKTFIDLVSDEESKVHEVVRKLKEKLKEGNK
jgi:hypothetical protein